MIEKGMKGKTIDGYHVFKTKKNPTVTQMRVGNVRFKRICDSLKKKKAFKKNSQ